MSSCERHEVAILALLKMCVHCKNQLVYLIKTHYLSSLARGPPYTATYTTFLSISLLQVIPVQQPTQSLWRL